MKKTIILSVTALAISLCCLLSGCGDNASDKLPVPSVQELGTELLAVVDIPSPMEITPEEASVYFGTSEADFEESYICISEESIKANMVCIVKCTDGDAAERVKEAMSTYLSHQAKTFQSYLPDEYAKLKDVEVKSDSVYVYCAVGENADGIKEIFNKYFK